MKERRETQRREHLFRSNSNLRFQRPQKRGKSKCTRLRVDDVLLSDPTQLLEVWSNHFRILAESQIDSEPELQELRRQQVSLLSSTFQMEETFLDTSFSEEEVRHAVQNLKLGKSAGPDDLVAEHLRHGGGVVIIWLTGILNSILDVEEIPQSLKTGLTIPIYKGGGKDPLEVNSYRGITLNSVISKVLELLILQRLDPLFADAGIPHPNQSAYRKNVSCADAIFATQEVINRYLQEGSKVYMCLYDLQKAFDSVEFPVLLRRLFDAGVNSKTWRILNSWYTNCQTSVRLGQHVSPPFTLGRGVRQGSILSPSLFLLIMDPLIRELQSLSVGISVNNMYAGGFLHADDIRTLATTPSSLETQVSTVAKFTRENFLKLNTSKCEIIVFGKSATMLQDGGLAVNISVKDEVKCLGFRWKGNLSSASAIQERILKSRRAFFEFGSIYAFQGNLSPLSSSSIYQQCVLPILLYGVENWIFSSESLQRLESFQGEIAKRILKLPRWYSNTAACVALGWKSIHAVCTIRKLRFLHRVMTNEESVCYRAFSAMVDNVEALSLVKECRELEETYGADFTSQILDAIDFTASSCAIKEAEDHISKEDKVIQLQKASKFCHLIAIAESVGWRKLWDLSLDHGPSTVKSVRNLVRIISYPNHATSKCPKCDIAELDPPSLPAHIIDKHTNSESSWDTLINSLVVMDPIFFTHVLCLLHVF